MASPVRVSSSAAAPESLPIVLPVPVPVPVPITSSGPSSSSANAFPKKKVYLWEWQLDQVRQFIQQSDLFPKRSQGKTRLDCEWYIYWTHTYSFPETFMIIMHMFTCSIFYFYTRCYISIDINCNREEYAKQFHIANTLLLNLCRALEAASVEKNSNEWRSQS